MRGGILVLLLSFSPVLLRAAAPPESLLEEYERRRRQLIESEEQRREIMSSLFQINRRMKTLVIEKSKADQKRMTLENSTRSLAEQILELQTRIRDKRVLLRSRLGAIYKMGGQGLARFLFSSNGSSQLERNLKILGLVARHDLTLMKEYSSSVADLSERQERFLARLEKLKKARERVAEREARIQNESLAKARILESIRRKKVKALTKLRALRKRGLQAGINENDEFLDLLLKPSFFERKGNLPSPVAGPVVRKFGLWKDPEYNVTLNHKGLLIRAASGTLIQAVFPGKVAFRGPVEGFGETLILDHGDHYYTVYGGLSRILASDGSEVAEGQKIAAAEGPLYFEIRHFSEPYDPLHWMKGHRQ